MQQAGIVSRQEVEGFPIKVRGFEFMPLFIYQADGSYGLGDFKGQTHSAEQIKGKYLVAETASGLWCGIIADEPEQAYWLLSEKLKEINVSLDKYRESLSKARSRLAEIDKTYGVNNGFQD